jgi:UDP-N-acetylglucosamine--dolichyl-phosphate N-acetylglucosaminephosphotransferase
MISFCIILSVFAFGITFAVLLFFIPRLRRAGVTQRDMNKSGKPEVADMGGIGTISGFIFTVLLTIACFSFYGSNFQFSIQSIELLAALVTILIIAFLGTVDDLLNLSQISKALLPLIAAFPLVAINAGSSTMNIPFFGQINLGLIYPLLLVPIGITGAANAVNMLAAFNGLELGMGLVATGALGIIAYSLGEISALILLLVAFGAMLATIYFNWYPARLFIGNIGTYFIGTIIATAVIIGDFELAGVIVMLPYCIDFVFKAVNRFPKSFGHEINGKLYCPTGRPVGLGQFIMLVTHGISERRLVITLILIEAACGLAAVLIFGKLK